HSSGSNRDSTGALYRSVPPLLSQGAKTLHVHTNSMRRHSHHLQLRINGQTTKSFPVHIPADFGQLPSRNHSPDTYHYLKENARRLLQEVCCNISADSICAV